MVLGLKHTHQNLLLSPHGSSEFFGKREPKEMRNMKGASRNRWDTRFAINLNMDRDLAWQQLNCPVL